MGRLDEEEVVDDGLETERGVFGQESRCVLRGDKMKLGDSKRLVAMLTLWKESKRYRVSQAPKYCKRLNSKRMVDSHSSWLSAFHSLSFAWEAVCLPALDSRRWH